MTVRIAERQICDRENRGSSNMILNPGRRMKGSIIVREDRLPGFLTVKQHENGFGERAVFLQKCL